MTELDPPRLKHAAGSPDALRRALGALSDGAADSARIARVGQRLGPLLDAPPSAYSGLRMLSKLTTTKLVVVAAALGLSGSLWWWAHNTTRPAAQHAPVIVALTPRAEAAPESAAEGAQAVDTEAQDDARVAPPLHEVAVPPVSQNTRPRAVRRAGPSRAVHVGGSPIGTPAVAADPVQHDDTHAAEPVAKTPAADAPALPALPPVPEVIRDTRSEAALLIAARAASRSDQTAQALALLDTHRARFPQGQLAPERELLAIEVLRRAGQHAQAERRLARFRADYPDSFHLPHLTRD